MAILKRHPHLKALVFDRDQVIQFAASYWRGKESPVLLSRLTFQAGDVLESLPLAKDDKDIYLLSAFLHGMDDESCVKVLRNLAAASGRQWCPYRADGIGGGIEGRFCQCGL